MDSSVADEEAQVLAEQLRDDPEGPVLERCRRSPELAGAVSRALAEQIRRSVTDPMLRVWAKEAEWGWEHADPRYLGAWPPERTWVDYQDAAIALAAVHGAHGGDLAEAVVHAAADQVLDWPHDGTDPPLHDPTFTWLVRAVPDLLAALLPLDTPQRLWRLPDQEGASWFVRLVRAHDHQTQVLYQTMMSSGKSWPGPEWPLRLHALAAAAIEPRPALLTMVFIGTPPPSAAIGLVHLACVYGTGHTDHVVRAVARHVAGHRGDDAVVDADLYWWGAEDGQRELLRWVLELSGPEGARQEVVEAARAAGLIDDAAAAELAAPLERPAWADGDVPWELDGVHEAGVAGVPDGRLAGGDPYWTFEGLPFEFEVPPGRHAVRVATATHPLAGRQCAAIELTVDRGRAVATWELVPVRGGRDAYRVEVGVAALGAAAPLLASIAHEQLLEPEQWPDRHRPPSWAAAEDATGSGFVCCTVGPQHQSCRTWIGRGADGDVVRVVTALGLLSLDPVAKGTLPWT